MLERALGEVGLKLQIRYSLTAEPNRHCRTDHVNRLVRRRPRLPRGH